MRYLYRTLKSESGGSLTLLVVTLPMLLAVLGVVLDAGLYGLHVVQLSGAADSAALAAVSAMDFDLYRSTGELKILPDKARVKAEAIARANYSGQLVVEVDIPVSRPNRVNIDLRTHVETVFMRIFGFEEVPLHADAVGILRKKRRE